MHVPWIQVPCAGEVQDVPSTLQAITSSVGQSFTPTLYYLFTKRQSQISNCQDAFCDTVWTRRYPWGIQRLVSTYTSSHMSHLGGYFGHHILQILEWGHSRNFEHKIFTVQASNCITDYKITRLPHSSNTWVGSLKEFWVQNFHCPS